MLLEKDTIIKQQAAQIAKLRASNASVDRLGACAKPMRCPGLVTNKFDRGRMFYGDGGDSRSDWLSAPIRPPALRIDCSSSALGRRRCDLLIMMLRFRAAGVMNIG